MICLQRKTDAPDEASATSKRVKLSPEGRTQTLNGGTNTPQKGSSPLQKHQMSEWLNNLNAANGNIRRSPQSSSSIKNSPSAGLGTPVFGRAVKSAGITPPGSSQAYTPEKPSLRVRKPKSLNLKEVAVGQKKNQEGGAQQKVTGKVKGKIRLVKSLSNAATQRFAQIPLTNGAVNQEEEVEAGEFSVLTSKFEDVVSYGTGYTVHVLPEVSDDETLKKKVAAAYASEIKAPPSYLGQDERKKPRPWEKSKRDLNNLDSWDITGRWWDTKGQGM